MVVRRWPGDKGWVGWRPGDNRGVGEKPRPRDKAGVGARPRDQGGVVPKGRQVEERCWVQEMIRAGPQAAIIEKSPIW